MRRFEPAVAFAEQLRPYYEAGLSVQPWRTGQVQPDTIVLKMAATDAPRGPELPAHFLIREWHNLWTHDDP